PNTKIFLASADNCPSLVFKSKPYSRPTASIILVSHVSLVASLLQGKIPPSAIERIGFKINSGSTFKSEPKPVHFGQAPCGELKEKVLGSISGSEILSMGQANRSEKRWSSIFLGLGGNSKEASKTSAIITDPSPILSAVSMD